MQNKKISECTPSSGAIFTGKWEKGTVERNRRIYDFELVYFARGLTKVVTPGRTFLCPEGSAVIIPPDLVHCSIAVTEVERWCIHFDWFSDCRGPRSAETVYVFTDSAAPFRPELCAAPPADKTFPAYASAYPEALPLIRTYFAHSAPGGNALVRKGALLQLLGGFPDPVEAVPAGGRSNRIFLEAKDRIDAACFDPAFRIAPLAAALQITPNHLARLFRQKTGCSMGQYVARRRLAAAQARLQRPEGSIGEIAFQCGFADCNYFCRFFRKYTGTSPGEYRNRSGAADQKKAPPSK